MAVQYDSVVGSLATGGLQLSALSGSGDTAWERKGL